MRLLFVLSLLTGACLAQSGNTITVTGSGAPTGSCSYIFQYIDSATGTQYNCKAGAWNSVGGGGAVSAAFSALTSSTNTTAAMIVGSGASLSTTGTGTVAATSLTGTPTLPNGTLATTQSASDNSTKVATTAYVDRAAPAMVQLETHTATNSATLNFTTCFTNSSYHTFKVKIKNLVPATNTVQATLRMSTDGGATYDATSGIYDANAFVVNAGGTGNEVGLATTSMQIGWQSVGNTASNGGVSADFDIYDPANGANAKVNVSGNQMYWSTSSTISFWGGSYHSTVAVNAFQVLFSAGNITSGVVTCYGVTP